MAEPWHETAFGAFYPVLYAHRDAAEARRCLDLLPRLAPLDAVPGGAVLDLGCGDGRHLAQLARAGLPAVGLDLSGALLQAARGCGAPLVRGDMRHLPLRPACCSAVLSLFTAFGYFGAAADGAVVAGIGATLAAGGHWYLDYLDADRVRDELATGPIARERRAGPLVVREERRLAPGGHAVGKQVTLHPDGGQAAAAAALGVGPQGLHYEERVHLYDRRELDDMAGRAGLLRVASAGDYDGAPLGRGPRWLLVYRKEA